MNSLKNIYTTNKFWVICLLISVVSISTNIYGNVGSLSVELDSTLKLTDEFEKEKLQKIKFLKEELSSSSHEELTYSLTFRLFQEYKSFIYDSAFKYNIQLINIAHNLNKQNLLYQAKIQLGFTYLSSGLFKESLDTLLSLNSNKMNIETRVTYYTVLARTYYDLADYHGNNLYNGVYTRLGNIILDSALQYLPDTAAQYWMTVGLRKMKQKDYVGAAHAFNYVVSQFNITEHEFAITTSSLGWVYRLLNRDNDAIDMLIKAVIADVKASTKETVASRNLAELLYEQGETDLAYKFIKIALSNANYYNARHRKLEISEVMPIIDGKRLATLENQKKKLINYSLITTFLILVVTVSALIIYTQLKKLRSIRKILQNTNNNLKQMNEKLLETNKIKEEYIGYFFNINSEFIDMLENFQKTIQRKIMARQFDDISNVIRSTNINKEREKLFINFDKIFLKLFPNFVEKFNKLFAPEDHIVPENKELLDPNLRIFALIRLGITDNEKIAKFLNYSVNTIYTYKTKLKHKTIVPRDEFYDYVMAIKAHT